MRDRAVIAVAAAAVLAELGAARLPEELIDTSTAAGDALAAANELALRDGVVRSEAAEIYRQAARGLWATHSLISGLSSAIRGAGSLGGLPPVPTVLDELEPRLEAAAAEADASAAAPGADIVPGAEIAETLIPLLEVQYEALVVFDKFAATVWAYARFFVGDMQRLAIILQGLARLMRALAALLPILIVGAVVGAVVVLGGDS